MPKVNRKDSKGRVLKTGEDEVPGKGYKYRYNNLNGRRVTVYAPDLVTLRKKENQILRDLEDGIDTSASEITLNEQFEKYMSTKSKLNRTTYLNYKYLWEHYVSEALGTKSIGAIKKSDILIFYSDLSKKGLRNRTVGFVHRLIFPAMQLAVEDDIIRKNPCNKCGEQYNCSETERCALTRDEQRIYLEFVNGSEYKRHINLITFLLGTACRIGETLGLTWDNVDFKKNVIHIRKQLIHKSINGKMTYYINHPKTKAGIRDIPMSQVIRQALLKQRDEKMFLSLNSGIEIEGYKHFVFVNSKGNVICGESFYKTLNRISLEIQKDYNDFPKVSAHILRHTACTRMAEAGMDIKVLQTLMGHEDIKVLMRVYNHVQSERIFGEVARIGDVVNI